MSCEICSSDSSVDAVMWTCVGCPRKFHAACAGVTIQRGSLRRKDKKVVDVNSYVLPCCETCQALTLARLDLRGLSEQQKKLEQQLHANTEVLHKFSLQQEKPNAIHEAIDGMEILLTAIKNELAQINKSSSLSGSVSTIKNHITFALDIAMQAAKEQLINEVKTASTKLSTNLCNINDEICQINQLYIDTVSTCTLNSSPLMETYQKNDILDELKALSAKITAAELTVSSPPSSEPCASLGAELVSDDTAEKGGWRFIGEKKMWRADWTDYDKRASLRVNQQKKAEKARKRKKHARSKKHLKSNSTQQNSNHRGISPRNNFLLSDRELLAEAKNRFSRPPNNKSPAEVFNQHPAMNMPPHPVLMSPPNRVPSRSYRPSIHFQRGEILNPYPATDVPRNFVAVPSPSSISQRNSMVPTCEGCSCTHSCFRATRRLQ